MVEYNCPMKKKKLNEKETLYLTNPWLNIFIQRKKTLKICNRQYFPHPLTGQTANMKVGTAETRSRYFVSLRVEKSFLNLVQLKHVWNVITHFLIDWTPK